MKSNQKVFAGTILIVVAIVAGYLALGKKSQLISTPAVTIPQNVVYENQYMKVTIPSGWTAKEATKKIYNNGDSVNSSPTLVPNPAAVNITKGNYILYINTQASQASGVEGGRFAEIAMGAPSVDAVVKVQPSTPCGTSEKYPIYNNNSRVDLYVNNQEKNSWCATPSNNSTIWYFSYITDERGGYFNYYNNPNQPGLALVITMAYNSKDVNSFPIKGSTELNSALSEMTSILKTLELKQK